MVNQLTFRTVMLFVLLGSFVGLLYLRNSAFMDKQANLRPPIEHLKEEQANLILRPIEHSEELTIEQVIETKLSTVATTTATTTAITEITPTRFIYLTQTERCIPTYLKSPEVIGDTEACQCDVIILSYKTECIDTSLPHVQYIFNSSNAITWTVGRNMLYKAARERKEKYIHYILMDDDVQLILVDKSITKNPWRIYEESLKTFQPAVVIILDLSKRSKFPKKLLPERPDCEVTRYIQIYRIDGLFSAYHYQVIDYILPYTTTYDSESWWWSQEYTNIKLNVRLNGLVVIDPRFRTENNKHREYARKNPHPFFGKLASSVWSAEPEKYRNLIEPIIQQWSKDFWSKFLLGRQTCKRDLSVHPYRPYENL